MKATSKKEKPVNRLSYFTVGIVVSTYHHKITDKLKDAAISSLLQNGIAANKIHVLEVPGAYELIYGADKLATTLKADGIIALGCVIKGDTDHDVYINQAVAQGLMQLTLREHKPFAFGLLTTNTEKQAKERAGGKHGNKGEEAAMALIGSLIAQPTILSNPNDL